MMKILIYIISTASVTFPCSSSIPSGRMSSVLSITLDGVFQVGLPFNDNLFLLIAFLTSLMIVVRAMPSLASLGSLLPNGSDTGEDARICNCLGE
jgi:hypothetical protein